MDPVTLYKVGCNQLASIVWSMPAPACHPTTTAALSLIQYHMETGSLAVAPSSLPMPQCLPYQSLGVVPMPVAPIPASLLMCPIQNHTDASLGSLKMFGYQVQYNYPGSGTAESSCSKSSIRHGESRPVHYLQKPLIPEEQVSNLKCLTQVSKYCRHKYRKREKDIKEKDVTDSRLKSGSFKSVPSIQNPRSFNNHRSSNVEKEIGQKRKRLRSNKSKNETLMTHFLSKCRQNDNAKEYFINPERRASKSSIKSCTESNDNSESTQSPFGNQRQQCMPQVQVNKCLLTKSNALVAGLSRKSKKKNKHDGKNKSSLKFDNEERASDRNSNKFMLTLDNKVVTSKPLYIQLNISKEQISKDSIKCKDQDLRSESSLETEKAIKIKQAYKEHLRIYSGSNKESYRSALGRCKPLSDKCRSKESNQKQLQSRVTEDLLKSDTKFFQRQLSKHSSILLPNLHPSIFLLPPRNNMITRKSETNIYENELQCKLHKRSSPKHSLQLHAGEDQCNSDGYSLRSELDKLSKTEVNTEMHHHPNQSRSNVSFYEVSAYDEIYRHRKKLKSHESQAKKDSFISGTGLVDSLSSDLRQLHVSKKGEGTPEHNFSSKRFSIETFSDEEVQQLKKFNETEADIKQNRQHCHAMGIYKRPIENNRRPKTTTSNSPSYRLKLSELQNQYQKYTTEIQSSKSSITTQIETFKRSIKIAGDYIENQVSNQYCVESNRELVSSETGGRWQTPSSIRQFTEKDQEPQLKSEKKDSELSIKHLVKTFRKQLTTKRSSNLNELQDQKDKTTPQMPCDMFVLTSGLGTLKNEGTSVKCNGNKMKAAEATTASKLTKITFKDLASLNNTYLKTCKQDCPSKKFSQRNDKPKLVVPSRTLFGCRQSCLKICKAPCAKNAQVGKSRSITKISLDKASSVTQASPGVLDAKDQSIEERNSEQLQEMSENVQETKAKGNVDTVCLTLQKLCEFNKCCCCPLCKCVCLCSPTDPNDLCPLLACCGLRIECDTNLDYTSLQNADKTALQNDDSIDGKELNVPIDNTSLQEVNETTLKNKDNIDLEAFGGPIVESGLAHDNAKQDDSSSLQLRNPSENAVLNISDMKEDNNQTSKKRLPGLHLRGKKGFNSAALITARTKGKNCCPRQYVCPYSVCNRQRNEPRINCCKYASYANYFGGC